MQQPEGVMQVHAVIANDGRKVIVLEWPNGDQLIFDRDEAVRLSLTMLSSASRLFVSAEQFERSIAHARGEIFPIHCEAASERPQ